MVANSKDLLISWCSSASTSCWNLQFRRHFTEMEIDEWISLSNLFTNLASLIEKTARKWPLRKKATSVKSVVNKLNSTADGLCSPFIILIWKSKVRVKVKVFLWIFALEKLNIRSRLQKEYQLRPCLHIGVWSVKKMGKTVNNYFSCAQLQSSAGTSFLEFLTYRGLPPNTVPMACFSLSMVPTLLAWPKSYGSTQWQHFFRNYGTKGTWELFKGKKILASAFSS